MSDRFYSAMQLWRRPWQRCLFCVYRPVIWQTSRPFGSTAHQERSVSKGQKQWTKKVREAKAGGQMGPPPGSPKEKESKRRRERVAITRTDEFQKLLNVAYGSLKEEHIDDPHYSPHLKGFKKRLDDACRHLRYDGGEDKSLGRLRFSLREGYIENGPGALPGLLKEALRVYVYDAKFSGDIELQEKLVDFRYPAEWFPAARAIRRQIHLHVGPTNSGKTYHALKRLEEAKTGFYGGPLRLLAHEVYTRLNAKGIPCGLITGDEIKVEEENPPRIFSNTVEMVPLNMEVDVAVIDEIQMLADPQRGWAWTRALLGAQAHEIHLCGEERIVPLVRELAASMGDTLEIYRYERLNPLKPMTTSIKSNLQNLEKGDCVVAFSRITIHALKQEIERATSRRAAIVYGGLPAEIRAQQADLFNDPNNDYDFLVASDAIGMGLNLSCKRIIFESVVRRSPSGLQRLSISQVKQIGGRAGRYRSAMQASAEDSTEENVGFVTSLEDIDLPYINQALKAEAEPIRFAGILPPDHLIQNFANHFPADVPFGYVLNRLESMAKTHRRYFLCTTRDTSLVTSTLDETEGMSVLDKLVFVKAPITTNDPNAKPVVKAFARCVAENKGGGLLDIPELRLDVLDEPVTGDKGYLRSLEFLHRSLVLYLWLSFRCGGVFTDRTLATHVKELVEMKMDRALTEFSANSNLQKASSLRRQVALLQQMQEKGEADLSDLSELGLDQEEETDKVEDPDISEPSVEEQQNQKQQSTMTD